MIEDKFGELDKLYTKGWKIVRTPDSWCFCRRVYKPKRGMFFNDLVISKNIHHLIDQAIIIGKRQ